MDKIVIVFFVIGLIFLGCKTAKDNSLIDQNHWEEGNLELSQKIQGVENFESDSIKIKGVMTTRSHLFEKYHDQISIEKMIYDPYNASIDRKHGGPTYDALIRQYAILAKNGDLEVEVWLLDFFELYTKTAIHWNQVYSDGPGGKGDLFNDPMNSYMMGSFQKLPPSNRKLKLLFSLTGIETDIDNETGGLGPMYGDGYIFEFIIQNILKKYWKKHYVDMSYSDGLAMKYMKTELHYLKESLANESIHLVSRQDWKKGAY